MFLRLFLASTLTVVCAYAGAIQWTAPTTVASGTSYTVSALDTPDGSYHGQGTTTIYKNGAFFASGTPMAAATTTDTGNKTVTYTVVGWSGATSSRTVTITSPNQPPSACFDYASPSIPQGTNLNVWGWATDEEMGAPIARVDVLIDGVDKADATLGGDRNDVANHFARTDFRYSGWNAYVSTTGLSIGTHTVSIVAWDNQGASTNAGSKNFAVTAATAPTTGLLASPLPLFQRRVFTLTASSTDADGNLTGQTIDYLAPGSTDWRLGSANWALSGSASQWNGSATASHVLVCQYAPAQAGTWQFRARGTDASGLVGPYTSVSIPVRAVTSESDYDGDGIPDYWEIAYGLDPASSSDAALDPDNDRYTNKEEFGLSRNPKSAEANGVQILLRTTSSTTSGATVDAATWRMAIP